ncbi:MAG: MarR family transcriptional regulator, partial [Actinomycetota bacterium]|nr:MarR family transcriptional regulator [Actinomycetota bacterium]
MAPGLWLDEVEMSAWRELLRAHAVVMARLDRELEAEHGMSLGEYEVLSFLSEAADERMRMSELAQQVLISPSALTRRLDRLARRGWVARERCPHDARGAFAVLTPEGRRRLEAAAPTHVRGVRRHLVDRLSRSQLKGLAQALARV